MLRAVVGLVGFGLIGVVCLQASQQGPSGPNSSAGSAERVLLNRYCVTCHNERLKTAGLMLDKMNVEKVSEGAAVWEKVVRKLRASAMPPAGMPRPDKAAYDSFAGYLEAALDSAAATKPNPGRPAVHRLNRAEYGNAIRDLLALEIDAESLLPADDSGYGFDNVGDVLSVSPMLLDRYMSAARLISRLAIGDPTIRPSVKTYDVPKFSLQDERASEDLPFWSRGGIAVRHHFPLDGEYFLKIRLKRNGGRYGGNIIGLGEPHQLDVRVDGARIKLFTIGGNPDLKPEEVEAGLELRFQAKAGVHVLGVAFPDTGVTPEGMFKPPLAELQTTGWGPESDNLRDPGVERVSISGPYNAKGSGETPGRDKIFVCRPKGFQDEEPCARQILSTLARRAFRGPVTDTDVEDLINLYSDGSGRGFEAGIGMALQGMLVSPEFLFRIERDPPNLTPGTVYRISDLELASRLSFFLWSSLPDEQLLDLAEQGKLHDREVLKQQVQRMLRDSRSKALVDNFAGQWLSLRSLRSMEPNTDIFPEFDEDLRAAFRGETELFIESVLREDRSVLDLLNADYTFVNERLARHYGIPNIYGSRYRRVKLTDEARMGLLGKGSILLVTSHPNRTSPVLRGKWVLENILGTPPPPPPPNVPDLQETKDTESLPMRQRLEQHRANPACASCHARMDPLGFALENFDAIGKWRAAETVLSWNGYDIAVNHNPIDTSGLLPDGTKFQGPVELREILLRHPEQFVTTVAEKLLTYALGRGVEYYDQPAVRQIMREAVRNDYRWSAIILGIVESVPFQMRMSAEQMTAADR